MGCDSQFDDLRSNIENCTSTKPIYLDELKLRGDKLSEKLVSLKAHLNTFKPANKSLPQGTVNLCYLLPESLIELIEDARELESRLKKFYGAKELEMAGNRLVMEADYVIEGQTKTMKWLQAAVAGWREVVFGMPEGGWKKDV